MKKAEDPYGNKAGMAGKTVSSVGSLAALTKKGEGPRLEFKRTTAELKAGMQTLCAFLNSKGGTLLFGINRNGNAEGQQVSEQTLHEITAAFGRLEPAAEIGIERVAIKSGREVLALKVGAGRELVPFIYDGRAYERVGNTTRKMVQAKYETLLLERAHTRRRWENEPVEGVALRDIDREEVLRVVGAARDAGRFIGPVGTNLGDILDRLKLRQDGRILQAAVVLFGKEFMPYYPQCELRMARFRGIDKTEFLDQRMVRASAFKLFEEAQLFCQRHFPLPGKIVPGRMERVDTPLIPPDAMREILVNALIHRDYSVYGGAISLAIFDDRVEVWSAGTFPKGITPAKLSRAHHSVQRNPIVADVFYRAGLIEKWGRGTNRVIEMCRKAGITAPKFEEITGAAVVTFQVDVLGRKGDSDQLGTEVVPSLSQVCPKSVPSDMALKVLLLAKTATDIHSLMAQAGHTNRTRFRRSFLQPLIDASLLEYTIPTKPNSSKQRYVLTPVGKAIIEREGVS